jgi:hypothetical protein
MQTHTVGFIGPAFANNKSMGAIFNGAGSGRIVRIQRVWMLNNQTAGVTGVLTTMNIRRTTAQSAGTAVVPVKHDTASTTLAAQILVATGATVTLTGVELRRWMWSNDEPAVSSGTSDEFECLVPLNLVWDSTGDADIEPIVLREGEGISVHHPGSTTVGICDIFVEFTSDAT